MTRLNEPRPSSARRQRRSRATKTPRAIAATRGNVGTALRSSLGFSRKLVLGLQADATFLPRCDEAFGVQFLEPVRRRPRRCWQPNTAGIRSKFDNRLLRNADRPSTRSVALMAQKSSCAKRIDKARGNGEDLSGSFDSEHHDTPWVTTVPCEQGAPEKQAGRTR